METRKLLLIVFYIIGWNITSITAGIYNKEYLDLHGLPVLLTLCQSAMGVICGLVVLGGLSKLQLTISSLFELRILVLLGFVHCFGTVLTNFSTLMSAASFTHTIKASEPLFAVFISVLVLGTAPSKTEVTSVVITVVGIALACSTEFNFQLSGFLSALLSNVVFSTRSIFSKKLLTESKLDNQNVFLYISVITCNMLIPCLIGEVGYKGWSEYKLSLAFGSTPAWLLFKASISHYLYNMFSFLLLNEISPVSHSMWGAFKRLFVIYAAVLYFRNPVSIWNLLASLVAVGGVTLYSVSGPAPKKPPPASSKDEV